MGVTLRAGAPRVKRSAAIGRRPPRRRSILDFLILGAAVFFLTRAIMKPAPAP